MPAAVAVTWNVPTCALAVTEIDARPVLPVVTVAEPVKVTLAPLGGAANVIETPGTPLPCASCTLTLSGVA